MAQPDISQILAALARQQPSATPQASSQHPTPQPPHGYPPAQPPSAPPGTSYLPQPSSTGNMDLSGVKPISSGSVSIAEAIAKAKSIAEARGLSYDPRSAPPRDDPRLAGRGGFQNSRSRSRSPVRRDAYGGNPYRDERREDPRRGSFRRSPSPDRGYRNSREPQGGSRDGGEVETIRVKASLVGLIIGRNGENLRRVETETGAKVQFIQAKEPGQTERQCTITGSTRAREGAKAAIFAIIDENGGQNISQEKGSYQPGMPGRAKPNLPALRDGEASTQIMVPDKTVGLIIGRGGETIKQLQERSGCHVNIVGENKSVNGLRPVNLIGSERATALAKELILEVVESDSHGGPAPSSGPRDRGMDSGPPRGGGAGGRDHIEKTIHVPSEAVGMIIGKGGETIKDTQRVTGCQIKVDHPVRPDVTRRIDLAGTAQAMAEAERIIWEKVDTVQQRDSAAGRSHGGGSGGYDQGGSTSQYDGYSQQQQQQAPSYGGYGQYQTQAAQQMRSYQMPTQQQQAPAAAANSGQPDPYAAFGGQAAYIAWYAQQMANLQQQQQQQGGPPPGAQ